MVEIKAKYIDFKHRLFIGSGLYLGLIMFVILEVLISNYSGLSLVVPIILQVILLFILLLFIYLCFTKSKCYINKIELKEQSIVLEVYLFDKKIDSIDIPYSELLLDFKKNLYERYPRYTLEFKSRRLLAKSLETNALKQYEIGYWNKKNLKNAYKLVREKLPK